jgi:UDP-galactopyranose mutase
MRVLVIGAGLSGCVAAEQFVSAGHSVTVFEKNSHIAGHAYDYRDDQGAMVHAYGPHLFHTNDMGVVEYLSKFTAWLPHEHRILSFVNGKLVPVPINLVTLRELYGYEFTPEQMQAYLTSVSIQKNLIATSEDWLLASYGPELTELFFTHYIRKQWGRGADELDWTVASRIKPRFSDDCRTFTDQFQAIPKFGYTELCADILDGIRLELNRPYKGEVDSKNYDLTVFTGPVDEFFGHCFGSLPYRSLSFTHGGASKNQAAPTIVYPDKNTVCTRSTDWRQIAGAHGKGGGTSILIEYPTETGEPMYPVPAAESRDLYAKYEELAKSRKDVLFCGRLGTYKYYNMDQVVRDTLERVKLWL